MVVTDNGTGFVSTEFEEFLRANGVKHTTSALYHPTSNGLAERAVQVVKNGLKKRVTGSMSRRLAKVLFSYRMTPQTITGTSPAELLLGRRLRTRMDLLRPNAADRVEKKQQQQKAQHDRRAKPRVFSVGDAVFMRNSGAGCRWLPGQIVEKTRPVSFRVLLEDGRGKRCHQDQLRSRVVDERGTDSPPGDLSSSTPVSGPSLSDDVPPILGPSEAAQPNSSDFSRNCFCA